MRIIFKLVEETRELEGNLAECGVYRGGSLLGTALYLAQHHMPKKVFGFDSFQGFDSSVLTDISLGGPELKEYKRIGGFDDTSLKALCKRINALDLAEMITLVPGYFTETLPTCDEEKFSFVFLDCDLYDSCKECLMFFYPRMPSGGVMLFDEYEDPVFPVADSPLMSSSRIGSKSRFRSRLVMPSDGV